jgi:hypothetical protein
MYQRKQQMQKQREESYEEATVWNDFDDGADGYAKKKEKKRSVASSHGVATTLKKLERAKLTVS